MLFYRMEFRSDAALGACDKARAEMIAAKAARYNAALPQDTAFYISIESSNAVIACAAIPMATCSNIGSAFDAYMQHLGYIGHTESISEITFQSFERMLMRSEHHNFIDDKDDELIRLNLYPFRCACSNRNVVEDVIKAPLEKEHAVRLAREKLLSQTMIPELDRIYEGDRRAFCGHPVHYIVSCSSRETERSVLDILLGALLQAGRLPGRRYNTVMNIGDELDSDDFEVLYQSWSGGVAVLNLSGRAVELEFMFDTWLEATTKVADTALRHRRDVLTVICVDRGDETTLRRIETAFAGVALVKLTEDIVGYDKAMEYLNNKALADRLADRDGLQDMLEAEASYTRTELDARYNSWHDAFMRTKVFTQYANVRAEQKKRLSATAGSATEELDGMIGLAQVKRLIHEIIDYGKVQKLLFDKGFTQQKPALHMVFSGNPGTAKTTVARLFARIMRENGVLSEGALVEVGRGDLVGKYVGWTAQIVKDKFKVARGSVLFIDEAYSLVEERGLYGDEAITTIVQEMENARENTVVIFAGYPEKMAAFIARNPGLKSRIAFHIDFPDYSLDELMDIFRFSLQKASLIAAENVEQVVRHQLAAATKTPDFGNGRYVRSLIEQATLHQASRLIRMDTDSLTPATARTLLPEDFQHIHAALGSTERRIGFG